MGVVNNRSMIDDFSQGVIDNSYIQLMPNRGGIIENPPVERLQWPQYGSAEMYRDDSMTEAMELQLRRPVERLTRRGGDPRY